MKTSSKGFVPLDFTQVVAFHHVTAASAAYQPGDRYVAQIGGRRAGFAVLQMRQIPDSGNAAQRIGTATSRGTTRLTSTPVSRASDGESTQ